ncbi:MAG: polymer-forming cytoskeletal protein [Pseudomonadota bacterium]
MFSKAKRDKDTDSKLPEEHQGDAMMSESKNGRRQDAKKTTRQVPFGVPSLISADMVIKGEIRSEGEVQFDGEIDGDIRAKGIVIGEGASVRGEIVAEKVKVAGSVKGQIRATRVELTSSARVDGDITHTALMIEAGARFDGTCRHSDQPLGDEDTGSDSSADMAAVPNVPREREAKLREAAATTPLRRDEPKSEPANVEPMQPARAPAAKAKANLR